MREIWVVADRFSGFAEHDSVCTTSQVAGLAPGWAAGGGVRVRLGQGIGEYERGYLHGVLVRLGLVDRVRLDSEPALPAGRRLVHKHVPSNVLLTEVRADGGGEFAAGLRLAADNELLLDHQTGQHVQGMVVIEAVRQMFLASFEVGYRHRFPERDYYVVWNGLELEFHSFLFPLPASLRCVVEKADLTDPQRLDFTARIELSQAGSTVAAARNRFTAFDTARIAPAERRRAGQALTALSAPAFVGVAA